MSNFEGIEEQLSEEIKGALLLFIAPTMLDKVIKMHAKNVLWRS
ncbi:hypothetical protein [Ewingella americana]|nr:hypothetical protein [Ewingella americana]